MCIYNTITPISIDVKCQVEKLKDTCLIYLSLCVLLSPLLSNFNSLNFMKALMNANQLVNLRCCNLCSGDTKCINADVIHLFVYYIVHLKGNVPMKAVTVHLI